jgi:hypothetical protein
MKGISMGHPLDDMLANLKVVRDGEVEAYLEPYGYFYGIGWSDLSAEEVALARMIFRWEPDDLRDAFDTHAVQDDWPELPDEIADEWLETQAHGARPKKWATVTRAWLLSLDGLLRGCQTALVPPEQLFTVRLETDWSDCRIGAVALTERLSAVSFTTAEMGGPLPEVPLGFVDRRMLYRSTALLVQQQIHAEITTCCEDAYRWIAVDGVPPPELYRILLAGTGRGGRQILTLDEDALTNYRDPDLAWGFREMAERIA